LSRFSTSIELDTTRFCLIFSSTMSTTYSLISNHLPNDPMVLFDKWYQEAKDKPAKTLDSVSLATWSQETGLANRIVLFKGIRSNGFSFFTNYQSRKSHDLGSSGIAAMVFYWPELDRQIRVEGSVSQLSHEESETYFHTRPRASQIAAWASKQSHPVTNREELEAEYKKVEAMYFNKEIPCPPFWGGFTIKPVRIEFWEQRDHRLHDRVEYIQKTGAWTHQRLAP